MRDRKRVGLTIWLKTLDSLQLFGSSLGLTVGKSLSDFMKTASNNYTHAFFEAALQLGAQKAELLSALNVDEQAFDDPTLRFSCDSILKMLSYAKPDSHDASLGLLAGENFRPSSFGDVGHAAICCDTLGDAMQLNNQYQMLNQQFGITQLQQTESEARISWAAAGYDPKVIRSVTEAAMAGWFRMGRWLLWQFDAKPNYVSFRHDKSSDHCADYFGCEVRYGEDSDYIACDPFFADIKIPQSNPQMLLILKDRLKQSLKHMESEEELSGRVYQCIQQLLGERNPTVDTVANMLHIPMNVITSRLKSENTSFREVLKAVRIENFRYHEMEGVKTLTEIALALGYSDHSAFTRAYRSWFGHAPSHNGTWALAKKPIIN